MDRQRIAVASPAWHLRSDYVVAFDVTTPPLFRLIKICGCRMHAVG